MTAIEEVEWEDCSVEPRRDPEIARQLRNAFGFVPPAGLYFADCPWAVHLLTASQFEKKRLIELDIDLANMLSLVVSQDNSCRFCFAATRLLMRVTGHSDARIQRLEQDLLSSKSGPKERAALDFARRLSRWNPPLSKEDIEPLRTIGFSDTEIREMAVVAAFMCASNRFVTFPALPPQRLEELPRRAIFRWVAPVVGWLVRRRRSKGQPESLSSEAEAGPFAYLVSALRGLPFARSLRFVIDEAWRSPLLDKRLKALLFAVIARGLGTPHAERESIRLLVEEGLSRDEIESILAHLGSPLLDEIESLVVPFARETIWYSPAVIQRRTREIQKHLTKPQFMELLGVVSLANMLCRLDCISEMAEP